MSSSVAGVGVGGVHPQVRSPGRACAAQLLRRDRLACAIGSPWASSSGSHMYRGPPIDEARLPVFTDEVNTVESAAFWMA